MNKFTIASAIIQLISALVLVGISIYYFVTEDMLNFALFLGVGALFIALSVRTIYKYFKGRKK